MSLLTIVQKFTQRTALPGVTTVVGNTDPQVRQILTLLEEECVELSARHPWKSLINECVFTTLATESQGTLASLGSGPTPTNNLKYILNNIMYNRTTGGPVWGPVGPQDWQNLKAMTSGPYMQYRIRGVSTGAQAHLIINPTPAAGETIAFEYVTNNWVLSGADPMATFDQDSDTILLDEGLVSAGLKWRWKKEKGLTYAEDFNSYERMVENAIGRDGTKKTLRMDECVGEARPGIFIPPGSWPL